MRVSSAILFDICPWPYCYTEPYISMNAAEGDMSDTKLHGSVITLPQNLDKEDFSLRQEMKAPNASNGSTCLNGEIKTEKCPNKDEGQDISSVRKWSDGDIGPIGMESDEPSYPNSPNSPKKLTNDIQSGPPNQTPNRNSATICKCSFTKFQIEHKEVDPICKNDQLDDVIPSIFLSCMNAEICANECNQCNSLVKVTININGDNSTDEHSCGDANQGEDEKSCDDFSDDAASSAYYVPSTVSVTTEETYSQPPTAPPRASRAARLQREETQSEADACIPSSSAKLVPYKSLRSQSDPYTQYTTVIKPTAIRPAPVNLDAADSRESIHSMIPPEVFMQPGREQRSAFHEHLRNGLEENGPLIFFSRSLEASLPSANEEALFFGTSNRAASPRSPNRRYSFNDASNERLSAFHQANHSSLNSSALELQLQSGSDHKTSRCEMKSGCGEQKRHTLPSEINGHLPNSCSSTVLLSSQNGAEPIHMTLEEVRNTLKATVLSTAMDNQDQSPDDEKKSPCRQFFRGYFRPRKSRKSSKQNPCQSENSKVLHHAHHRRSFPSSMKATLSNWFGLRRSPSVGTSKKEVVTVDTRTKDPSEEQGLVDADELAKSGVNTSPFTNRALPPLPVNGNFLWEPAVRVIDDETSSLSASSLSSESDSNHNRKRKMDYAASIEKVKDCGWYWGPISGETAEKLLANEPDGSFVVRDSSDEHYIFSLTFKLNGFVRHVRIEHDHGNFSFGCQQKFRSNTIVDFIENAVEHSRSGRYLFFLHRRPILGPMRVQLLHPVSRFKQVQSLQHLCRFIILKSVRRDLIDSLPLPRCLRDYLNTPHYYSEELSHLPVTAAAVAASPSLNSSLPASS